MGHPRRDAQRPSGLHWRLSGCAQESCCKTPTGRWVSSVWEKRMAVCTRAPPATGGAASRPQLRSPSWVRVAFAPWQLLGAQSHQSITTSHMSSYTISSLLKRLQSQRAHQRRMIKNNYSVDVKSSLCLFFLSESVAFPVNVSGDAVREHSALNMKIFCQCKQALFQTFLFSLRSSFCYFS